MEFNNLNDMNDYINKDKEEYEIVTDPTIGELVDTFKIIGLQDKVYAFNDDVHSLDDISDELRNKKLSEITDEDEEEDEEEVSNIIKICEGIAKDNERELTDDDLDEIREEKMYRGEDSDEI